MLDEHLELLTKLWNGEPVHHEGLHYRTAGPGWSALCYPPPKQRPRIPIWVGGTWPGTRPFVRAARWDGVVPMRAEGRWEVEDTAAVTERVPSLRTSQVPFDVAIPGESDGDDATRFKRHREHASAGATWWIESIHPWRHGWSEGSVWPLAEMRERIEAGP